MEEGKVFMMVSNEDIAERLKALIVARRSLGITQNEVIRRAIRVIEGLPYNLSGYYHENSDLPSDLKRNVRQRIRSYIAYTIVHSDLADKIYEEGARLKLSSHSKLARERSLQYEVERAIYDTVKERYRTWEETLEREEPPAEK